MIGVDVQITDQTQRVEDASDRAAYRNLGHAAASLRKEAIGSIRPSPEASPPGTPPHTRPRVSRKTGKALPGQLQRAIVYAQDRQRQEVVIGPRFSVVGESGSAHEFGGEYKDEEFPERAFMWPALLDQADRLGPDWEGTIGP